MAGEERRSSSQPTRRRERVIKQDPDQSHLSEEGESPSGPEASFDGDPLDHYGGPLRRRDDPPNEARGNAGQGGFSTVAEGAYYGEAAAGAAGRQGAVAEGETPRTTGSQGPPPRAARRSDRTIHEDVCELLAHHPEADAGDVAGAGGGRRGHPAGHGRGSRHAMADRGPDGVGIGREPRAQSHTYRQAVSLMAAR